MDDSNIIPFGKYKGLEVEEVKQRDPAYLQWLMAQGWFAEKFGPIYQIVVNNFAPPSEDTPAHNAMQVKFLEHGYRDAFWNTAGVTINWDWLEAAYRRNTKILREVPQPLGTYRHNKYAVDTLRIHREQVRSRWATWRRAHRLPPRKIVIGEPRFEQASDVEFVVTAIVGWPGRDFEQFNVEHVHRLAVELKPSLGDDYPSVLRQIKRQQQIAMRQTPALWFLLVDDFTSQAVTFGQVQQMFARDAIKVIRACDVGGRHG